MTTVVVTGSSRGIGRAVATDLAAAGVAVVVNGRNRDALDSTVSHIKATGGTAVGVLGSAADPEVVDELVQAAQELGDLESLINIAGTAEPPGSSILTITDEQWGDLIDAHLNTVFRTCRAFAPVLVARGGGSIVNTSSHAFTGIYGGTGYPAGKGAVVSLTYALAAELREHKVRVNAVCPGARTRLSEGPNYEAHIAGLHQRGLLSDLMRDASLAPAGPEYLTAVYSYLASPRSAHITGEVFAAAGGYLGRFRAPSDRFVGWRDPAQDEPWTVDDIADLLAPKPPEDIGDIVPASTTDA